MTTQQAPKLHSSTSPPLFSWKIYALRALLVAAGLAAWFTTQALLGKRGFQNEISDGILYLLGPIHTYLLAHVAARNALLIASSGLIDALGIFLLASSIFGRTIRPFLGLFFLFSLRQICQSLVALPAPHEMIWPAEGPGFPSLLVTYGVGNDLFFSGHTALAVFAATELARRGKMWKFLGIAIALFEILAVLALHAHWTMDVYAGALTAIVVALLVGRAAPPVDRFLARL